MPVVLGPGFTLNDPALARIMHAGLWVAPTGVVSTSTDAAFDAAAPTDAFLAERWKAADTSAGSWRIDHAAATVSAAGIAGHTFGSTATEITLEISTAVSGWITAASAHTPADDSPILFLFAPLADCIAVRLSFAPTVAAPSMAWFRAGSVITMERPAVYGGRTDYALARRVTTAGSRSITGTPLVTTVIREGQPLAWTWQHLSPAHVVSDVRAWLEATDTDHFMIAERPGQNAGDVALAMVSGGRPIPRAMGIRDLYALEMEAEGYVG